ncbi:MAG: hypothetical protein KDA84_18345 [Planctomycetaceae bacterium]|nr:hypothetical protein [Planctomycetaceae bacterium]
MTPPHWLSDTINRVAAQFHSVDSLAPIGCHYFHDESCDVWEVTLFISQTETVGGEYDGKRTSSRFSLDLSALESIFSEVSRFAWQALSMGEDDDLGPHVSLEGRVQKHNVWLRIVSEPPPQFEAGRIADTTRQRFIDLW